MTFRNLFYPIVAIDQLVLSGVSKGVKAVNWVTGMTRTEQAQLVSSAWYVPSAIDNFSNGRTSAGIGNLLMGDLRFLHMAYTKNMKKRNRISKTRIKATKICFF